MIKAILPARAEPDSATGKARFTAENAMKTSATIWFLVAALGQWIFLSYIVAFYGGAAARGDLAAWNANLSNAYIPGATMGNIAAAGHLIFAVIILGGGPLQLVPQIRARFPAFHRWIGRTYLAAVVTTAIVGLYMLARSEIGGAFFYTGFTIQAVLILIFAAMALRHAMARRIVIHRRWALRLFMVASAVWFFRIILMIWAPLTGGAGIDFETGQGPFLDFMSFGQYLPLVILEIYFRTQDRAGARGKYAIAASLFAMTLLMAGGITMATMFMWLPHF